ncbi:MAG: aminodeoxychorismate lyase [Burkholderiales bacterium PBB3]|nr:MAG: aminodeoxychorismate lyase [Burkholderiales bacterium PBB3]
MILLACLASVGVGYVWLDTPMDMPSQGVDLAIEPGDSAKDVVTKVAQAGVAVHPMALYGWFRLSGESRKMKAGSYELAPQTTPRSLLNKLVQGDEALRAVTLVEGWTFKQVMAALAKAPSLQGDAQQLVPETLMTVLGKPGIAPEGRFFPDTYTYAKGSSDVAVLKRAMRAMDKKLDAAWASLGANPVLQSPEQVLILASIIEKETGTGSDRALISAVFNNRLRIGMRLQTDPTVIYGLGERFDGNLRKIDLLTDTPWNTYTRAGLPPTPISMPGKAALLAAVQPAASKALYFVARGDGSSQFSNSLDEHNRAVNKYQRGQ